MAAKDEWLQPLYRRVLCVAVAAAGFAAELLFFGDQFWMILFGGVTLYAVYDFFLSGKYSAPQEED
ncbi:MAG: hypothetical protein AAF414_02230 [Pseudomonadota bacterium]